MRFGQVFPSFTSAVREADMELLETYARYTGTCGTTTCQQTIAAKRARRRSVKDRPTVFKRDGAHRHLLSRDEAIGLITGHGAFEYRGRYVQDSTFMRERSLWEKRANSAIGVLRRWSPELVTKMGTKVRPILVRQIIEADVVPRTRKLIYLRFWRLLLQNRL